MEMKKIAVVALLMCKIVFLDFFMNLQDNKSYEGTYEWIRFDVVRHDSF